MYLNQVNCNHLTIQTKYITSHAFKWLSQYIISNIPLKIRNKPWSVSRKIAKKSRLPKTTKSAAKRVRRKKRREAVPSRSPEYSARNHGPLNAKKCARRRQTRDADAHACCFSLFQGSSSPWTYGKGGKRYAPYTTMLRFSKSGAR